MVLCSHVVCKLFRTLKMYNYLSRTNGLEAPIIANICKLTKYVCITFFINSSTSTTFMFISIDVVNVVIDHKCHVTCRISMSWLWPILKVIFTVGTSSRQISWPIYCISVMVWEIIRYQYSKSWITPSEQRVGLCNKVIVVRRLTVQKNFKC